MKSLIQKFTEAFGPSGYEAEIRDLIRNEIEPYCDEIRVDALGNLIAVKGAESDKGMSIMLAAHMDEIGLIATHIDDKGYIRFITIGGVRPQTLPGGRVHFANGKQGIIGTERIERVSDAPPFEKMYIDVGATSRKDCPIQVGDVAVFERPFLDLGKRLVAKAMDDRIGAAVMVEVLRQLKKTPHLVYFVFTTQEEVGLRGATTAAYGLNPDLGIAVDVTGTGDTPNITKLAMNLGDGPAVKIRDGGMLADPKVVDWMIRTAEKANIPYQREVLIGGTTDARAIQLTRSGVPSGCVSIPCRYVHAPSEMVDYDDVQNAVKLILALLSNPIELG